MASKDTNKGYTNAFWNTLEPFMDGKSIQGAAQYVAIEVMVGQLIRRVAFGLPFNWMASTEIHTLSVPMIGQLNFGDPFKDFVRDSKGKVEVSEAATDGAKAIPGTLVGYCAHKIRQDGLKIPSFGNKDVMALLIGKVVSRPLMAYMFSSLPKDVQTASIVLNNLMNRMTDIVNRDDAEEEEDERRR